MSFIERHKQGIQKAFQTLADEFQPRAILDLAAAQDFVTLQEFIDEFPLDARGVHRLLLLSQENVASWNGKQAAEASHIKSRKKRERVVDYWRANIGADKSNEFAAELLQKEFPDLAHRTLARYVAEAKKLPSAGTL